ncbi:hypothetical protein ACFCXT_23445 [Streptomyces vinaceus]|uniref:hypothetical protein n=1 Tax=Streptomyces vinaceus TaxID=1960 RepID=UPI0035DFC612
MNRLRAFFVLGVTALIAGATVSIAAAWPPGSITLAVECRNETGKVVLTVADKYNEGVDFNLTASDGSKTVKGSVKAESKTEVTVPYAKAGVVWTVTVVVSDKETLTDKFTLGSYPGCLPKTPETPKPTSTPSTPASATPTPTPTPKTSTQQLRPVKPSSAPTKSGELAETAPGGDSTALLLGAGGLVLAGGGALALARRGRSRA